MVQWQENLSVGVLKIDIQHKLLFEKFNRFAQACQSEAEGDTVHQLFWFLEAYAVTHFNDEEELMLSIAYPDYLPHRTEHREFAAEIGRVKERLKTEGPGQGLVSGLTQFVSSWLVQHISHMDRAIGRFVNRAD